MTEPLVTVLVAAYNSAATIEQAIASVFAGHDIPVECVVVDDGSTDGTTDVLQAFAGRDARVRVVVLPSNGGVSAARNRGLRDVRGAWLTFLDADDRFLPGGIEALVAPTGGASVPDADRPLAVVGQRVWFDGTRTYVSRFYDIPDIREPGRTSISARPGLMYYASTTGKLLHRSLVQGLEFTGRVLGDQPWTIRALLRAGDRIEVIGDVVYEWRRPAPGVGGTSITSVTRSSIDRGVEAVGVAVGALEEVRDEAAVRLAPDDARRVAVAYTERLLRSDLAMHVQGALGRRDPEIGRLFDAITRFIAAVPAGLLEGSRPLTRDLLQPPLRAWLALDPDGRRAFLRLLAAAERAAPGISARASDRLEGLAFGWVRKGLPGVSLVILAVRIRVLLGRIARRARRTLTSVRAR